MAELLTTNLSLELEKTNQVFSRWAEKQIDLLDSSDSKFAQLLEESECTIAALKDAELQLEEARTHNDTIKDEQHDEIQRYITQTEQLKLQYKNLQDQLQKYGKEEEKEAIKLEMTRAEHDEIRDKMERAVNDLTRGVRMYMSLGLEFQKADGDCMKFIFTQIDPSDPLKAFYFLMFVDSNDCFQLVESSPLVDEEYSKKHLTILNNDNDVGKFVVNMRRAFCNLI
jgi:hypothetical protein